jgi:hypothetical protein
MPRKKPRAMIESRLIMLSCAVAGYQGRAR